MTLTRGCFAHFVSIRISPRAFWALILTCSFPYFKKFEKKSLQPIVEQSSFTFRAAAATSWLTG